MRGMRIAHWISTGLLTVMMLMSAGMYFFNHADIEAAFTALGYPTYLIIPLAVAKLLGLLAIWTPLARSLTEWAYAGFFFDFVLAAAAHYMVDDGEQWPAVAALVLLCVSYVTRSARAQPKPTPAT